MNCRSQISPLSVTWHLFYFGLLWLSLFTTSKIWALRYVYSLRETNCKFFFCILAFLIDDGSLSAWFLWTSIVLGWMPNIYSASVQIMFGKIHFLIWLAFWVIQIQVFEPFSILGLEPGASDSEIKKAYRRLSIQYHPDKNPDPGGDCLCKCFSISIID